MNKLLGKGNHGEAYLLDDGTVLKLTNDWREYDVATCIKGHQNRHIIDIYDCWETTDEEDRPFAIKEELLQMETPTIESGLKEQFLHQFKQCWYTINEHRSCPRHNYFDLLMDSYASADHDMTSRASAEFHKQTAHLPQASALDQMLKATESAFEELHRLCPTAELDLNSGNIGFTNEGRMKYFDILSKT